MPRSGLRESPAKTRYGVVIDADFPVCHICKKTFSSKNSRKRHLLTVHAVSENTTEEDGLGDPDDTVTWCPVCSRYHGPLEEHSPVRSSSVLSYISVPQSVSGEEVENTVEEEEELNTAIIEEIKEDVPEKHGIKREVSVSPVSYISVTPSIKEIDEDIKPSIETPMSVSCMSFDVDDTFSSIIGRNYQPKNAINGTLNSETVGDENQNLVCDRNDLIKEAAKKINHECPECGKRFKQKSDKRRHEERVHMKRRNFQCTKPGCVKSFFSLQEYERHFKSCKASRRGNPSQRDILPKETRESFRTPTLPFGKPSSPPDLLTYTNAPHVKQPGLDWGSLVTEHKTNKFAVIPLYYRNNPPDTIGACLKRNEDERQTWRMRAAPEAVIEMEANVYTLRIPTATTQNSHMVIDFEQKMK